MKLVFHLMAFRDRAKLFADLIAGQGESVKFPLHAHEKRGFFGVRVLFEINNIAFVAQQKIRYGADDALLVGARD